MLTGPGSDKGIKATGYVARQHEVRENGRKRDELRLRYSEDADYMEKYLREYIRLHGLTQSLSALNTALEMHKEQKRAEGLPYVIHPMILAMHGIALGITDDDLLAVMLLHDVCEDCPVRPDELRVNENVRHGVRCITKTRWEGESKEAAMKRYMEQIRDSKEACIAKVFDRCHNVSSMAGVFREKRMQAYITETELYIYPLMEHIRQTYPEYDHVMFALEYQITSVLKGR